MNPIDLLKEEHEDIERELIELETMKEDSEINLPNLAHTFKKLHVLWDGHEKREEKLFKVLKKDEIIVPVKKMMLEHQKLAKHKDAIYDAIDSGSEAKMKKVFDENVPVILTELRAHIADEDEVLYRITSQLFTTEEIKELWESIK